MPGKKVYSWEDSHSLKQRQTHLSTRHRFSLHFQMWSGRASLTSQRRHREQTPRGAHLENITGCKKNHDGYIFFTEQGQNTTPARSLSLQPTSCISSRPNSTLIIQICKPLSNVIHILSVKVSTHMRVTQADCSLHLCFLELLRHFNTTQVRDPVYKKMQ